MSANKIKTSSLLAPGKEGDSNPKLNMNTEKDNTSAIPLIGSTTNLSPRSETTVEVSQNNKPAQIRQTMKDNKMKKIREELDERTRRAYVEGAAATWYTFLMKEDATVQIAPVTDSGKLWFQFEHPDKEPLLGAEIGHYMTILIGRVAAPLLRVNKKTKPKEVYEALLALDDPDCVFDNIPARAIKRNIQVALGLMKSHWVNFEYAAQELLEYDEDARTTATISLPYEEGTE